MDMDDDDGGGGDEGAPAWMATFSDLATLLLTFFVLLLSFAEMDVTAFKELLGSIREAFGVQFETQGPYEAMSMSPVELSKDSSGPIHPIDEDAERAMEEVEKLIEEKNLEDEVEVLATERGIVVRIKDKVLFPTGSADLQESATPVLEKVAELAQVLTKGIAVEGHTDDRPIRTSKYPSNWELSSARATQALRFMIAHGVDRSRLSVAGYADTKPIESNDSSEHRAANRRVEFVFERPDTGDTGRSGEPRAGARRTQKRPHIGPSLPGRSRDLSSIPSAATAGDAGVASDTVDAGAAALGNAELKESNDAGASK